MANKFGGNTGKLRGIASLRNTGKSKSVSPKVDAIPYSQPDLILGMPESTFENPSPLLFRLQAPDTPNQEYNRQSQQARYERGVMETFVGRIEENFDELTRIGTKQFFFSSNRSPSNNWMVTRTSRSVIIEFLRTLTLFGEANYQLLGDENTNLNGIPYPITDPPTSPDLTSNWIPGEDFFEWKQESGFRTAFFSDNTALPVIILPASAGGGGPIERSQPIIIKATPIGDEVNFDRLLIFTIPTSFYRYTGIINAYYDNPVYHIGRISFVPRLPITITGSYWWNESTADETQPITWQIPNVDKDFIIATQWLTNENGSYLPEEVVINPNKLTNNNYSPNIVQLKGDIRYRPNTIWEYGGSDLYQHLSPDVLILKPNSNLQYGLIEEPFVPFSSRKIAWSGNNDAIELDVLSLTLESEIGYFSIPSILQVQQTLELDAQEIIVEDTLVRSYIFRNRGTVDGRFRGKISGFIPVVKKRETVTDNPRSIVDGRLRKTLPMLIPVIENRGLVVSVSFGTIDPNAVVRYQNFGVLITSSFGYSYIELDPNVIG